MSKNEASDKPAIQQVEGGEKIGGEEAVES